MDEELRGPFAYRMIFAEPLLAPPVLKELSHQPEVEMRVSRGDVTGRGASALEIELRGPFWNVDKAVRLCMRRGVSMEWLEPQPA
jgi:hypothetical protein